MHLEAVVPYSCSGFALDDVQKSAELFTTRPSLVVACEELEGLLELFVGLLEADVFCFEVFVPFGHGCELLLEVFGSSFFSFSECSLGCSVLCSSSLGWFSGCSNLGAVGGTYAGCVCLFTVESGC